MLEKLYDMIENSEEESKSVMEFLSQYAGRCGESVNGFLLRAVTETVARDNGFDK